MMTSTYNRKPIGEYAPSTQIAGMMYPMGHFGIIWKTEVAELYPWELTHEEEEGSVRIANGVTASYMESLRTMQQVISLRVNSGHDIADERRANTTATQNADHPFVEEKTLGFLANRSSG